MHKTIYRKQCIKICDKDSCCDDFMLGQAMVEFTIILFLIMILCSGMLYSHRLLNFDFWAMQEARFMAFSKTWVQIEGGCDDDYNAILSDDDKMKRPKTIRKVEPTRAEMPDEEVGQLLAMNKELPVNSVWQQKTSDMIDYYKEKASFVSTALATSFGDVDILDDLSNNDASNYVYESDYERGIVELLKDTQFGKQFCGTMKRVLLKYGVSPELTEFSSEKSDSCASNYDSAFGVYLARNVNLRSLYDSYSWRLKEENVGIALENVIKQEVINQFYSFFDDEVKDSFTSSLDYLSIDRHMIFNQLTGAYFNSLIAEARYFGAANALSKIQDYIDRLRDGAYRNRNPEFVLSRDRFFSDILHIDVASHHYAGGNWFELHEDFHPFPEDLGFAFDDLFDGVMENVLYNEDDSEKELLLEESNISVEVQYPAEHGLFSAATRRFDVEGKNPKARFYLVTQPWHIPRLFYDGAGSDYFSKGSSSDLMGARTDEGLLRKRTYGLWLMPRRPDKMILPLAEVAAGTVSYDLGQVISELGDVIDFIGVADTPDAVSKPFEILVSATQEISNLIGFDFSPPVWPAVRPDAYPGSTEIVNDNLAGPGTNRTFSDYVNEQRNNRNRTP